MEITDQIKLDISVFIYESFPMNGCLEINKHFSEWLISISVSAKEPLGIRTE